MPAFHILFYDVVDGFLEKRNAYRPEHLDMVNKAVERGELFLGGVMADPPDSALLIFRSETPEIAEAFAKADPYVTEGLVTQWRVRKWNAGAGTAVPA